MYSLCDQRHNIMIIFIVIRKMKQLRGVHKSKNPIGKKNGWKMKLHCYYYSKKIFKKPDHFIWNELQSVYMFCYQEFKNINLHAMYQLKLIFI